MQRCGWVSQDPLYIEYHDTEWGVAQKEGRQLFEMICLEGQQAGLSWITVLKKRQNYRQAFHQFDPVRVAAMGGATPAGYRHHSPSGKNPGHYRQRPRLSGDGRKWRVVH